MNFVKFLITPLLQITSGRLLLLCVRTLKGGGKFKGKQTLSSKNDIRNFVNFHASSRKPKKLHFAGLLLFKAYKFLDEKVQKSYVSGH